MRRIPLTPIRPTASAEEKIKWLIDAVQAISRGSHIPEDPENITGFDEAAQDAVGSILTDSADLDFTYTDATPSITAVIKTDAVDFAQMQNIATDRLIGRDTAATGDPEEISVSGGIEFTGSAGIRTGAFTGDVTKAAGGTALTIANDAVTNAQLANMAQSTIKGRAAGAGTGDPTDLTAAQVLAVLGSLLTSVVLQVFTTPGADTYTPTAGMTHCIAISTGGGGGSGGADSDGSARVATGGGGAGATCIERFTAAQIGASQTVTIGAAGAAGDTAGSNGGNGGDTTFGSLHTAGGGVGGNGLAGTANDNVVTGGAGGTATGGALNVSGGAGGNGATVSAFMRAGSGGASLWGGGGAGAAQIGAGTTAGGAGVAYGSGGGGSTNINDTNGIAGAVGAAGVVIVIEFVA